MDACITLDQIESRTATSLAIAIYTRRVRDGFVALIFGKPALAFLNFRLKQLKMPLRVGALDNLSNEQLSEVAILLKQLNAALVRLVENGELRSHGFLTKTMVQIEDNVEDFESILENIYLSLNPDFHGVVSSAIEKLHLGVGERVAMSR